MRDCSFKNPKTLNHYVGARFYEVQPKHFYEIMGLSHLKPGGLLKEAERFFVLLRERSERRRATSIAPWNKGKEQQGKKRQKRNVHQGGLYGKGFW
eukprot:5531451-Amphidinium_carterae.3